MVFKQSKTSQSLDLVDTVCSSLPYELSPLHLLHLPQWAGQSPGAGLVGGGGKQSIQSLLELSGGPACGQLPLGSPTALLLVGHTQAGSTSVRGPGPTLCWYVGAVYS